MKKFKNLIIVISMVLLICIFIIQLFTVYHYFKNSLLANDTSQLTRNFGLTEKPKQVTQWTRIGDDKNAKYHATFCQLLPYTRADGSDEFCYVVIEERGRSND